ncbi:hypothetical protein [uncultured Shewanella sp.]|uniref:hypothetical protein n=1 Tax=uncultured Shewanella sp. TaxID=173975 RepID=UPI002620601D|nr:hypothetical protein [uncultured Shewanella sp.]
MAKITLEIITIENIDGPTLEGNVEYQINAENQRDLSDVMAIKLLESLNTLIPQLSDEVLAETKTPYLSQPLTVCPRLQ